MNVFNVALQVWWFTIWEICGPKNGFYSFRIRLSIVSVA